MVRHRIGEAPEPTFLGVVIRSGAREERIVGIEHAGRVEYELARGLVSVSRPKAPVIGIARTNAAVMGEFDLQTRTRAPRWRVVDELERLYDVRAVPLSTAIPEAVDVLMVPQASNLEQGEMDRVREWIEAGKPALLAVDPMPTFDPSVAPTEPLTAPGGSTFAGGQALERGDTRELLAAVGLEWDAGRVIFDSSDGGGVRPAQLPPHVVFVDPAVLGDDAPPLVRGLSNLVALFPGDLVKTGAAGMEVTPLIETSPRSGFHPFEAMIDRSNPFFGVQGPILPRAPGEPLGQPRMLGARVRGEQLDVIVLADLDLFSDAFYAFYTRGGDLDGDGLVDLRIDNVNFILNCIDELAGDTRFIELRRRQPRFRRLETFEAMTREARMSREARLAEASAAAEEALASAQKELDAAVAEIEARQGLDETTKTVMIQSAQQAQQRRFEQRRQAIEREQDDAVAVVEREHRRAVSEIEDRIRVAAVLFPPLPALVLGVLIVGRRRRREAIRIPESRRASEARSPRRSAEATSTEGHDGGGDR
jgi:ABC-2 type transport system permease protein